MKSTTHHCEHGETTLCRNCFDSNRKLKATGLCSRCYNLYQKKRAVEKWNLDQPETLKHYPTQSFYHSKKWFSYIKKSYLSQVTNRIDFIHEMAKCRKSCPEPIMLEYLLRRVAVLAGADDSLHYHSSDYLARNFPTIESRTALFNLLRDIEEYKETFRFSMIEAMDEYDENH